MRCMQSNTFFRIVPDAAHSLLDSFARPDIASPRAAVSAAKLEELDVAGSTPCSPRSSSKFILHQVKSILHRTPGTSYTRTAGARGQLHRYVADCMPVAVNRVLDSSNWPVRDSRWHQCQAEPSASNPGSLGSTGLTPVRLDSTCTAVEIVEQGRCGHQNPLRSIATPPASRDVTLAIDRRCHKKIVTRRYRLRIV